MAPNGTVVDPKSWGEAINRIGPTYAVIFAMLALGGYLAVKGVPAIVDLTVAINHNSDVVTGYASLQEKNQNLIIQNQGKIIDNATTMIGQHTDLIDLAKRPVPCQPTHNH